MQIDSPIDVRTTLGEGPVFRCPDHGSELLACDFPGQIGSMALREDGEGAICARDPVGHSSDGVSSKNEIVTDLERHPASCLEDGEVDRRGRFCSGPVDTMEDGANGALHHADPDMSAAHMGTGTRVSDGSCFATDDRTSFSADSRFAEGPRIRRIRDPRFVS